MLGTFRSVRSGERRATWAAFATLFGIIGSHAVLETARDALFLARIPATRLPWVYLAIAAASLLLVRLPLGRGGRATLALTILAASGGTAGFYFFLDVLGEAGFYALYVWSGVLTTLVLVRFWTQLGRLFTPPQAKRLYGVIGAGSVLGAIAGSAVARGAAEVWPAEKLLLVSATGLVVSAFLSLTVAARPREDRSEEEGNAAVSLRDTAAWVSRQPYARAVGWLILTVTAAVTVADFLFKAIVAEQVEADELGSFFASVYLALNVVSFAAQLGLVRWILRRFDLAVALAVLPALLLLGSLGLVVTGVIWAAVALKGADGTLRHSLHRTATELLFVPLPERWRGRVKELADVVCQKGGQALASLGILGLVALGASDGILALGLAALAGWGVVLAFRIRRPYLALFRDRLQVPRVGLLDRFPALDVASLETLVATLDSEDPDAVVTALDVLEREGKAHVVPGLILWHPSEAVVIRALGLFMRTGRTRVAHVAGRLLTHRSSRVRAAAIAARSVLAPDVELLRSFLRSEESPDARAAATVHLATVDQEDGQAREALHEIAREGTPEAKRALAEAIALRRASGLDDLLVRLADDADVEVRRAALESIRAIYDPRLLPTLISALGEEGTRDLARSLLAETGADGLEALDHALGDAALSRVTRWHIPKTLARFAPGPAAEVLLRHLGSTRDGLVRYRILRALEALLRRDPDLELDREPLRAQLHETVRLAYRLLELRLAIGRDSRGGEAPGHGLLDQALRDKQDHAVGRAFRLLGLMDRREDFAQIHRVLTTGERDQRATALELVENVLQPPLRQAILGLVDDMPDEERPPLGAVHHPPARPAYREVLVQCIESESETLRDIALYRIAEMGLTDLVPRIEQLEPTSRERSDAVRTLRILRHAPATEASRA